MRPRTLPSPPTTSRTGSSRAGAAVNLIPGVAEGNLVWVWGVALPLRRPVGNGPVLARVPVDQLRILTAGIRGVVTDAPPGAVTAAVRIGDDTVLQVRHPLARRLAPGEVIRLDLVPVTVEAEHRP